MPRIRVAVVLWLSVAAAHAQRSYVYVGSLASDQAVLAWGTTAGSNTIGRSSRSMGMATVRIGGNAIEVSDRNYAVIRGLQPDTVYPYEVTIGGRTIGTGEFRTWQARSERLCFFAIGDWGTGDRHQQRVADAMWAEFQRRANTECPVRFIISTGDNIYGQFGLTLRYRQTGNTDDEWETKFFRPYRNLIARIPFFPSLGNHDGNETEDRADLTQYLDNFFFPGFTPARYYRFSYGGFADFFALDSTYNSEEGSPKSVYFENSDQHKWLVKNLAEAQVPWKIPYFHHPPYNAGPRHPPSRRALEHLIKAFEASGVRVVFNGHEHNFQYTEAGRDTGGIRYVITGAGGELRTGDVRSTMAAEHIEGWAAQRHFLSVELDKEEMRIFPIGPDDMLVVDDKGKKREMPIRTRLP